ncbi:MAG: homocysteine S-methyltransferase family protein, partial [Selenomonadaceae bacterium]|nr:homocysteine S-methyltransferase family protein [Selenomonadaceae bacterium]
MGRIKVNNPLEEALTKKKTLVLDGALATELEARGCNLNNDLWSASAVIEKPELIKEIYMDYLKAGADIITGASYQASIEGFVKRGLSNAEAVQMVIKSVRLAVEARDEFYNSLDNKERRIKPLVAASIGPYGAYMADGSEYTGNYSIIESDFRSFHR